MLIATAGDGQELKQADDVVINVNEVISASKEAERLGWQMQASDFTPVGLYLPPNTQMVVNVQQLAGNDLPVLLIGTYNRYSNKSKIPEVKLHAGDNIITDPQGGLIYTWYITDNAPTSKARLQFKSGYQLVPYYVLGKNTHTEWLQMLDKYKTAPDVILMSKRIMLVFSRANALKYSNERQDAFLQLIDSIVNIEDAISGLDGKTSLDKPNLHRYLVTQSNEPDIYMVAIPYRIAFNKPNVDNVLTTEGLRKDGWGLWHELGHMHQVDAWTWEGLGEVTVNIYSLAVERALGNKHSAQWRETWNDVDVFLAQEDDKRNFNDENVSVWVKLCMFQQLWLAFGDNFYHQLHKRTRKEAPYIENEDNAARVRYFMLTACEVSGKDLSDFFKKWGLKVPDAVYKEIAALKLPAPDRDMTALKD